MVAQRSELYDAAAQADVGECRAILFVAELTAAFPAPAGHVGPWSERILGSMPRGSLATREEIANAVTFLAALASSIVTGVNVVADGGLTKMVKF